MIKAHRSHGAIMLWGMCNEAMCGVENGLCVCVCRRACACAVAAAEGAWGAGRGGAGRGGAMKQQCHRSAMHMPDHSGPRRHLRHLEFLLLVGL